MFGRGAYVRGVCMPSAHVCIPYTSGQLQKSCYYCCCCCGSAYSHTLLPGRPAAFIRKKKKKSGRPWYGLLCASSRRASITDTKDQGHSSVSPTDLTMHFSLYSTPASGGGGAHHSRSVAASRPTNASLGVATKKFSSCLNG